MHHLYSVLMLYSTNIILHRVADFNDTGLVYTCCLPNGCSGDGNTELLTYNIAITHVCTHTSIESLSQSYNRLKHAESESICTCK